MSIKQINKRLKHLIEVSQHTNSETVINEPNTESSFKCPFCHVLTTYRIYAGTHVWTCDECPFVGFEYYNQNDINNLLKIIK